jgi:hypothetical protein
MRTPSGAAILTPSGSESVLRQVNSARANMAGINKKALPPGEVMVHPNGSLTLSATGGTRYGVRANGTIASYAANGKTTGFDRNGRVSSIHSDRMDIHHGAHGEHTIVSHRPDNTTLVTTGPHSGYIERTIVVNNHTFILRTVVISGRTYTNAYVAYSFGGVVLNHYVTPIFYAPGFYGWAYYPWAAPFSFRWGWFGEPWYLGPNPYFVAYPVYPSASLWLTDYLIGQTLSIAYQERADAFAEDTSGAGYSADASSPDADDSDRAVTLRADSTTPITPEIKAAIAEQVKQQIASDNAAAANPKPEGSFGELPYALHSANHIFVVSSDLDVTTVDQQGCGLQPGDILQLMTPPADGSAVVTVRVASSKRLDCPAGVEVSVSLQDLQEMQNNFSSQVELGLGSLLANQGHNGFPALSPEAVAAPPRPSVPGLAPVPPDELSTLLQKQQQQATEMEKQTAQTDFDTQNGRTN